MTTGGQINAGGGRGRDDSAIEDTESQSGQVQVTGTDDLLDEIDGLLENNAEQFVRAYVQKGGQ